MKKLMTLLFLFPFLLISQKATIYSSSGSNFDPPREQLWRGIIFAPEEKESSSADFLLNFKKLVEDALVPKGINLVIFDMHWNNFHFVCRPELERLSLPVGRYFTKADARKMSKICKDNGIRVMVGMNFLTHQNFGQLLRAFPEYQWPGEKKLWDPFNKKVNPVAFAMADELIDAFQPEGFHIGMDEAWDFDVSTHPEANGYNNAELWAKCVNEYYQHIVKKRELEMLIWSDMFDERHGKGTSDALKQIPDDIIMCYWEYGNHKEYPWIKKFLDEGFRVLACPWNNEDATISLVNSAIKNKENPKMLGILYTTWSNAVSSDLRPALLQEGDQSKLDKTIQGIAKGMESTIPLLLEKDIK
ncbi:family 20 glycosylhydrolase [Aureibaculum sp. 2210JD6-5]|uniref:family 20 glycosylhydrolase n=1 Tax=Aureibaculum sp. 2210JD6-5 TaxID=3103957 RepID=UPI002AAD8F69|nr:family 20 glycosylhydrolase [Aureibaculum sp. 2210JD6-5]MDY7396709.1 family 20 glycosylhydrolase [Aureibaculum sp. 2210JD6-5]